MRDDNCSFALIIVWMRRCSLALRDGLVHLSAFICAFVICFVFMNANAKVGCSHSFVHILMHLTMHLNYDNDDNVMFAEHKKKLWQLMVVVAGTISSSFNLRLLSWLCLCFFFDLSWILFFSLSLSVLLFSYFEWNYCVSSKWNEKQKM